MLDTLISILAPHHCCECGKAGGMLCGNCKYNIISDPPGTCLVCQKPTGEAGLCVGCRADYRRAWHVGVRSGTLERLINMYKFERARSTYKALGDLLIDTLPQLPSGTVIVPVPTIARHIRQRGYDHTLLMALYMGRRLGLRVDRALVRTSTTTQLGATVRVREEQAKRAFGSAHELSPDVPYILIDDIYTTGSTLRHAARVLHRAGAREIWVAVVARQTLD